MSRTLEIKVTTNSRSQSIEKKDDGSFVVHLASRPIDNAANEELLKLISEELNCPRSSMKIIRGVRSRYKLVKIEDGN